MSSSLQRRIFPALLLAACTAQVPAAWANNQPIAGAGCVDASSSEELGTAPDHLSARKVVPIGVEKSTQLLNLLKTNGHTASIEEFMSPPPGQTASQTGELYVLLVGERHICSKDRKEMAAILRAKATGVPIVLEGFETSEFKTLTGLGLKSEAAVVAFAPGGRGQTVTLIRPPHGGPTLASALDAVNRAIDKHMQALAEATLTPTRQAYAEEVWTVWLHTSNVICTLPYYSEEDVHYPQTGNLDFGVQITLVAQKSPESSKVINLQYVGAGFSPLAPGVLPIDNNFYFKGAYTLDMAYSGTLTARHSAKLNGTSPVQPTPQIGSHTVTKTNGFSWGLQSSCGGSITGPNCSISAGFNFSSETQNTRTIPERVIDASSSFGQVNDPNGSVCNDPANGCWEAQQGIQYYLSSTQTSSGGKPINLPGNDWYGFFDDSAWSTGVASTQWGDAFGNFCLGCGPNDPPPQLPAGNTVRNWPSWSANSALTEGEAGYTFLSGYRGDLYLSTGITAQEGIFAVGQGPKESRIPNGYEYICLSLACQWQAFYTLDLYTDSVSAAAKITVDASQVNYSGMPTCSMEQFTQQDLGIYEILNTSNNDLSIAQMKTVAINNPINTQPNTYVGSAQWLVGVSKTTIAPGQYQYVALCSSDQTSQEAMELLYNNGQGVSGALAFDGAGQPVNIPTNVSYNADSRTFTVN